MNHKLEVKKPNLPKGATVFVDGLGTFLNGEKENVSDAQVHAYEAKHGRKFKNAVQAMNGVSLVQASSPQEESSGKENNEAGKETDK